MRILIVASVDPAHHAGGAERVAAHLARGLSEEHDVALASLPEPDTPEDDEVPWRRRSIALEAPYHPADRDEASLLDEARWQLAELYNPTAADRIDELLAAEDPDVASVHNLQGLSLGLFDALADHDVPTAYTIHDFKLASPALNRRPEGIKRLAQPLLPLYRAWVRRRTRHVDRFLSPSHYLGAELERHGVVDAERLEVLPNGVPVDVPHAVEDPDPRLVTYGVLALHKGIARFVEAFHEADVDLELVVAGRGPQQETIQQLADADERITYAGYLPGPDLETLLATALATVVPSQWPENCPMVVLESLAAGTPVLHTGRGGLAELAPDGERGLRLPEDVAHWRGVLETLEVDRLAKMRSACREAAERFYSLEQMVEAYDETLGSLAGRGA